MANWSRATTTLVLLALLVAGAAAAPQRNDADGDNYPDEEEEEEVVVDIPEFVSSPANFTAEPGKAVRLTCQVNKMTVPLMWSRINSDTGAWEILALGEHLHVQNPEERRRFRLRALDNNGGLMLTVDDLRLSDEGEYKCDIMADPNNPKTIKFFVKVGEDPEADQSQESKADDVSDDSGGGDGGGGIVARSSAASVALGAALMLLLK